jgi:membrane associated rhomboid family serine protease
MKTNIKFTISNFFIILSAIFLVLKWFYPNLTILWWLHNLYFEAWKFLMIPVQFIFYNFLHWDIFHLLFNWVFIYIFWNQVEEYIGKTKYILFFLFSSFFIWALFLFFANNSIEILWYTIKTSWVIIWISGFALALLSFYTLILYSKWIDEYKWWVMAIILNILIWFTGSISLAGHLFWAISGIIFYLIIKKSLKKALYLKL